MITLAADCLLFELGTGESIPYSADMVSVELGGDTTEAFDPEFVQHATKAVFHYFKYEQARQTVTRRRIRRGAREGAARLRGYGAACRPPRLPTARAGVRFVPAGT